MGSEEGPTLSVHTTKRSTSRAAADNGGGQQKAKGGGMVMQLATGIQQHPVSPCGSRDRRYATAGMVAKRAVRVSRDRLEAAFSWRLPWLVNFADVERPLQADPCPNLARTD